jgi:hypothetical protein
VRLHHEVELQQLAGRVIRGGVEDEPLPGDRVVQNLSAVTHQDLLVSAAAGDPAAPLFI